MIKSIREYFRGVVTESKKVAWPTRQQIINNTITVAATVIVATIIFGSIDYGLSKLLEKIIVGR